MKTAVYIHCCLLVASGRSVLLEAQAGMGNVCFVSLVLTIPQCLCEQSMLQIDAMLTNDSATNKTQTTSAIVIGTESTTTGGDSGVVGVPLPARRKTHMPVWGIVVVVCLAVLGVLMYVFLCWSTDEEGNPDFLKLCTEKDAAKRASPKLCRTGHVAMVEQRLGRLEDCIPSLRSSSSNSRKIETSKAILDANTANTSSPTVPEFADSYTTHEIDQFDENRAAESTKSASSSSRRSPKATWEEAHQKKLNIFSRPQPGSTSSRTQLLI